MHTWNFLAWRKSASIHLSPLHAPYPFQDDDQLNKCVRILLCCYSTIRDSRECFLLLSDTSTATDFWQHEILRDYNLPESYPTGSTSSVTLWWFSFSTIVLSTFQLPQDTLVANVSKTNNWGTCTLFQGTLTHILDDTTAVSSQVLHTTSTFWLPRQHSSFNKCVAWKHSR